jgi:hypothetical protein
MHTGVIIALLPSDGIEDEHMTLVYAGDTDKLVSAPVSVMREACNRLSTIFMTFPAWVTGHDVFGDDEPVQVATIDAAQIWQLRHCVEMFHNSQFGLRPHITAVPGHALRPIGSTVWIDRVALWYGDHREEFRLGQNRPLYSMR